MNGVDWFASDRNGMGPARAMFDAEKAIELILTESNTMGLGERQHTLLYIMIL